MKLHGFFRSSAAQRVRIALNLKGVKTSPVSHHLPKGEHKAAGYVALIRKAWSPRWSSTTERS